MHSGTSKMDMDLEKLDSSVILEGSSGQRTCLKLEDLSLQLKALASVDSTVKLPCEDDSYEQTLPLGKSQFLCSFCNKTFVQLQGLINHRLTHTGERPYKCYSCEKSFTQLDYLKKHVRTHDQQRPYSCSLCYKPFHRLCDLQRHLVMHTGEMPYQCDECGKTFSNYYSKKRHQLSHSGEKSFKCNSCDKAFSHIEYLKKHLVMHTGERPFVCNICKKAFPRVSALRSHRMIHTGEKPYKCDSCDKTFNQSSSMKRHKLLHTGLKPYKCEFCERAFTESDKLKIHLTTHTGDKPYCCGLCDKTFSRLFKLRRHMVCHRSKGPYKCNYCEKSFTENYRLKIHTCMMHTEPKCTTEKAFRNLHNPKVLGSKLVQKPGSLRKTEGLTDVIRCQMSTENYAKMEFVEGISYLESSESGNAKDIKTEDLLQLDVIEVEPKTEIAADSAEELLYKDNWNRKPLNDNVKIINLNSGERRFMCVLCNKMYTRLYDLNRHQVTHTGERPYKCDLCDKSFAYFTSMKRHAIIHTGDKPYSCESCGKAFSQLEYLKKHMVVHAREGPYSDSACKRRFSKSSQLHDCQRTHMEDMPNKDESCRKKYYHSSADRKHVTKRRHECSFCPKKFYQLHILKRHLSIHAREKPYVCCTCEQGFKDPQDLIVHLSQHNGKKPHCCALCEKSFPCVDDAKRHALVHSKSRPLNTSLSCKSLSKLQKKLELERLTEKKSSKNRSCKKKLRETRKHAVVRLYRTRVGKSSKLFSNNAEMINTNKSIRNELYSCSSCGKRFSTLFHLTRHLTIHSEALYMCYLCDTSFAHASRMKEHIHKHMGIKPYKCSICDMKFSRIVDLRRHQVSHTQDRQYRCCSFDKTFNKDKGLGKKYVIKHFGIKSYMCILCRKAFSQLSELEEHKGTHSMEKLHKLNPDITVHNNTIQEDRPFICEEVQNERECHEDKHSLSTNENLLEEKPCELQYSTKVSDQAICRLEYSSSERPYACGICFEGFQTKSEVAEHFDSYRGANACSKFSAALSQTQSV